MWSKGNADDSFLSFEKRHVHETYEQIAPHFSASRYKEWPEVASFLQKLPPYALIADAGCGNGKYFQCAQFLFTEVSEVEDRRSSHAEGERPGPDSVSGSSAGSREVHTRKKLKRVRTPNGEWQYEKSWIANVKPTRRFVLGFDRCRPLLELALEKVDSPLHTSSSRNHGVPQVVVSDNSTPVQEQQQQQRQPARGADALCCDMIASPFRSGVFDAAVCIAVIHHYATPSRRRDAVRELLRLVRDDGGRVLIYVWALEKRRKPSHDVDESTGDAMIPWQMNEKFDDKKQVFQRYYHLFREGELEQLCLEALKEEGMSGLIEKSYYDHENWCVIVQRIR